MFKSRLSTKDFISYHVNNDPVSASPRWQYYSGSGGGSQRIVIHQRPENNHRRVCSDHFSRLSDRKHVTRVSVNNNYHYKHGGQHPQCYHSRSLSDLRQLLPDVTTAAPQPKPPKPPTVNIHYYLSHKTYDYNQFCVLGSFKSGIFRPHLLV
jgi:hypothetical protein